MQRRRSHTVSILLGTSAKTALPGDPFRLGRIRLSRALWLSVLVVMLGGLLEPEAAAQTVSFGAKTDFGTGTKSQSVAVGDFNGDGTLDLVRNGDRLPTLTRGTLYEIWSGRRGSNSQLSAWEADTLPLSYARRVI